MKWDLVLKTVAGSCYEMITQARSWEVEANILLDLIACDFQMPAEVKDRAGRGLASGHNLREVYAEKVVERILRWDIRCAEKLREIFPGHFPAGLRSGTLVMEYDEHGGLGGLCAKAVAA
jgi:hypothetical protein